MVGRAGSDPAADGVLIDVKYTTGRRLTVSGAAIAACDHALPRSGGGPRPQLRAISPDAPPLAAGNLAGAS